MHFADIPSNVAGVMQRIEAAAARAGRDPGEITLVAVTKNQPAEAVNTVLMAGVRHIGENYVPEADAKFPQIPWPEGVTRHFIGHLQTNKARRAIDLFDTVQSVDSLRLADRLNAVAGENGSILPVLLEVRLSGEPGKSGFLPDEVTAAVDGVLARPNLLLQGLMGMAPFTDDKKRIRLAFDTLRRHFLTLHNTNRRILSMGMTDDFDDAIAAGSTMVRIGTAIFGKRNG